MSEGQLNETIKELVIEYNSLNKNSTRTKNEECLALPFGADIDPYCDDYLWKYGAEKCGLRAFAVIVIGVGTIGNLLCFITINGRYFRKSAPSFVLAILMIVDTLNLDINCLTWWLHLDLEIDVQIHSQGGCKIIRFFRYYLRHLSSWTVLLMTIERTVAVYLPLRCKEIFSRRKTEIAWSCIALILLLINCNLFVTTNVNRTRTENGSVELECTYSERYQSGSYMEGWRWTDALLGSFIPFAVILTGNIMMIIKLLMRSIPQQNISDKKIKRKMTSTTAMLITISVAFLLLTSPSDTYFLGLSDGLWNNYPALGVHMTFLVIIMLGYLNSAINLFLYMISGRQFRTAFFRTFFGIALSVKDNSSYYASRMGNGLTNNLNNRLTQIRSLSNASVNIHGGSTETKIFSISEPSLVQINMICKEQE